MAADPVVTQLERLLRLACDGEIRSIAFVCRTAHGSTITGWAGDTRGQYLTYVNSDTGARQPINPDLDV